MGQKGRAVFFLNPRGAGFDGVIQNIVTNEFEVYRLDASDSAVLLFRELGDAVLFINVDVPPGLEKWREYSQALLQDEETDRMLLGFVSTGKAPTGDIVRVRDGSGFCGAFSLEGDPGTASHRIIEILTTNGARGQRQYVRYGGQDLSVARFVFRHRGVDYTGVVHDISSVGMSCTFDAGTEFQVDDGLMDIRIQIEESISTISGRIIVKRALQNTQDLYVVMFDRRINAETRDGLHRFIRLSMQAQMDRRLAAL